MAMSHSILVFLLLSGHAISLDGLIQTYGFKYIYILMILKFISPAITPLLRSWIACPTWYLYLNGWISISTLKLIFKIDHLMTTCSIDHTLPLVIPILANDAKPKTYKLFLNFWFFSLSFHLYQLSTKSVGYFLKKKKKVRDTK